MKKIQLSISIFLVTILMCFGSAVSIYANEEMGTFRVITDAKYEQTLPFSEGLAAVQIGLRSATSWGFIDTSGNEVIPTTPIRFKAAGSFSEGLAPMRQ